MTKADPLEIVKTKFVCTIGPKCSDKESLNSLIRQGMNVARLNLAHCTHEFANAVISHVREYCKNNPEKTQCAIWFCTI